MTSTILSAHETRAVPEPWKRTSRCPFCRIVQGEAPAFKVYEDEKVIAILDIAPLRSGHTLVIPKLHISRVSELPDEYAAQCGIAVSKVARAIAAALQNTALNVVCNQEYAQAVPHVHYHIIPAPRSGSDAARIGTATDAPGLERPLPEANDRVIIPLAEKDMHYRELEARHQLGEEDANRLVDLIRARL